MAREGRTAAEILSHYYTGTAIAPITAEIAGRLARPGTG
jgi:peptidoglycan hydrolase-like amidase